MPAATSSAMMPQPPGRCSSAAAGYGFTMSSTRNSRKPRTATSGREGQAEDREPHARAPRPPPRCRGLRGRRCRATCAAAKTPTKKRAMQRPICGRRLEPGPGARRGGGPPPSPRCRGRIGNTPKRGRWRRGARQSRGLETRDAQRPRGSWVRASYARLSAVEGGLRDPAARRAGCPNARSSLDPLLPVPDGCASGGSRERRPEPSPFLSLKNAATSAPSRRSSAAARPSSSRKMTCAPGTSRA